MIQYEYQCSACGFYFSEFSTIEQRHQMDCPECGKEAKKLLSSKPPSVTFFPEGIGRHIDSSNPNITNFEDLKRHLRESSTSTNVKWPEHFDGYSLPGIPNDWVESVEQECKQREKKQWQKRQERMEKIGRAAKARETLEME
jgi:putative FmdB family regulatory protein